MSWRKAVLLVLLSPVLGSAATTAVPAATSNQEETAVAEKPVTKAPASQVRGAADRLDLEATVVTGSRELPKVLYIVPWKKAELGDLPEQPFNSLLDEALMPIDRDEFRREIAYFSTLSEATPSDSRPVSSSAMEPRQESAP